MTIDFQTLEIPADPPTPYDIRAVMRRHNLDRRTFIGLAGVQMRALERWLAQPGSPSARAAPRGLWHLLYQLDAGANVGDLPDDPPTGEEIRAWLAENDLSQARLGAAVGIATENVNRWCSRGHPVPAPYWLWHAMRRLGTDPAPAVDSGDAPAV